MKHLVPAFALIAAMAIPAGTDAAPSHMPRCSASNPVVWVNTKSHVFHERGTQYFGKTAAGKYECRKAAIAEGAHPVGGAMMNNTKKHH